MKLIMLYHSATPEFVNVNGARVPWIHMMIKVDKQVLSFCLYSLGITTTFGHLEFAVVTVVLAVLSHLFACFPRVMIRVQLLPSTLSS